MVRYLQIIGLGLIFIFTGCQPDTPPPSNPPGASRLTGQSSRTWRLQTLSIRGSSEPIPPCRADDRWTFYVDGRAVLQNPTPCTANDPDDPSPNATGQWRFTNNERSLIIEGQNIFFNRVIIQLTDNTLVWEYTGEGGALVQETWVP
ncbi:MAG: lipocalin family protein [Bacteroidia bacterium]|nr:lipocalin family protein [Bacteroidia bacterium]MDW8134065.1 lipocalin family protein [Bacteroidia bacterium]